MSKITKESILQSLRKVNDPDLHKDLVTLGMIKEIVIENDAVTVEVELTTPACPLKDMIKADCIAAIKQDHPGLNTINVTMGSKVIGSNIGSKGSALPGVRNTIAVASGKGGVGKSTVAVNLAVALAKSGASVGLIDADIYGPSIPMMLGVNEHPLMVETPAGPKMIPVEKFGIKLMSIGFLVDDAAPVIWRGPMASGAVKQFMSDVIWENLDYLFFDLPPGTGDIQLTLCQTIPLSGAVIVTTPQNVSLLDARKALNMFSRLNVPLFGIVENMSHFIAPDTGNKYDIFGTGGGQLLADEAKCQYLGGIPIDPRIRQGGDSGTPMIYDIPDSEHSKKIVEIAQNLAAQISIINIEAASKPSMEIIFEN
jgi:ATP-binding protein involved in chromosome partitioning